jgi:methyl coenzyme M reductase subunit C
MPRRIIVASLSVLAVSFGLAQAQDAGSPADVVCLGSLSGAVSTVFDCKVKVTLNKSGDAATFEVTPTEPVKGLKSFEPGTFTIQLPLTEQAYTHRDLLSATARAVMTSGKKLSATGNVADRGDFEVSVESMKRSRNLVVGRLKVHAHLVPVDAKDGTEIQTSIAILTSW